jgi:hypothetical protein
MKKVSFAEKKSANCAKIHLGIFYAIILTLALISIIKFFYTK